MGDMISKIGVSFIPSMHSGANAAITSITIQCDHLQCEIQWN